MSLRSVHGPSPSPDPIPGRVSTPRCPGTTFEMVESRDEDSASLGHRREIANFRSIISGNNPTLEIRNPKFPEASR